MGKKRNSDASDARVLSITIRKAKEKKIVQTRQKSLKSGIKEVRVRLREGNFFLHKYLIPFGNLGISIDEDRKEILRYLNDPHGGDKYTRDLLDQLIRDYDGIRYNSRDFLSFKTKRFKKRKNYMQVKRKTL